MLPLVILTSIISNTVTSRLGMPLLLVFLAIGMRLGEEGPGGILFGGILFGDIQFAHLIGSAAQAVILFDGGMRTPTCSFRVALNPAPGLATVGVVIPSGLTGLFPWWWLGLSWLEA